MANQKIVLVVDDMAENLTIMRSLLNNYFDVRLAKSSKLALGLLSNLKVDLVLLDIEMPGMSGFELLRRLKERDSNNKDTPVIFVTSHADKRLINEAINHGAREYILKPIQAEALYKKIDAVIGMPESRTQTLEEKLKSLITAVGSGDGVRAESITRELFTIAETHEDQIRESMEKIAELILAFEYEKGIKKIQELLHNLSLNRMW